MERRGAGTRDCGPEPADDGAHAALYRDHRHWVSQVVARQLNYYGHRVGSPRGPGGRARQSLDGGALVFANRNRVATVNDPYRAARSRRRARAIATPRVPGAGRTTGRVVTPPACRRPAGRRTGLDAGVGSLLREAAQAAASGAS